ncbi:hypothetical protein J4G02_15430, partial [Candidatus Poribacteria bacterium]|nr:hypothetical protein [Candidatus Poribacteria bacterium]
MEAYKAQLAFSEAQLRPLYIEGYTDQLSYAPGDEIGFHISTSASEYSLEIVRVSATREVVWSEKGLPGSAYPIPEDASSYGCRWPTSFKLCVPDTWRSGYYEVSMRAEGNGGDFTYRNRRTAEGTLHFVVRSAQPGRDTKILLQLATNTYNAYNNWGGYSVYGYHGHNNVQGHRISFDRPMAGLFSRWESFFVE